VAATERLGMGAAWQDRGPSRSPPQTVKSEDRQTRIAGKSTTELYPYFGATGQVRLIDGYLIDLPAILLGEDGAPFLDRRRSKAYSVAGRYFPAPSIVLRVRCFAQLGCNAPRECERISSSLFEN
jgi:hypothetical protein